MKKYLRYLLIVLLLFALTLFVVKNVNLHPNLQVGDRIDSLNGIYVYYNGGVSHSGERNTAADGYNIGISYQCVEFVKRYYYLHYQHKMPDSYGNAKDFFDRKLEDGAWNAKRALLQFANPGLEKPQAGDLLIYAATLWNHYGHVAIVASVSANQVEIIQQNPGPFASSRERYPLTKEEGKWIIGNERILGWLRMKDQETADETN